MSGHDIAHSPVLLAIFVIVIVAANLGGAAYGRYLRRRGKRPPWQ